MYARHRHICYLFFYYYKMTNAQYDTYFVHTTKNHTQRMLGVYCF